MYQATSAYNVYLILIDACKVTIYVDNSLYVKWHIFGMFQYQKVTIYGNLSGTC